MALSNRARGRGYQPLIVTARLRCGVISDGLLPLDSILYYAQHRARMPGERIASRVRDRTVDAQGGAGVLPLQVLDGHGPHWYYAASCAVWPEAVADGVDHWTKRIDSRYVELLERQRARVPTSGGRYRAYRMPVAYRHALAVTWYAVGQLERVRDLLALVTHLGKKREMGWGAVIEWQVAPHDEDWSVVGPEGQVMRPVPDPSGVLYGYRPPYWLPRHQAPCRLPHHGRIVQGDGCE